MDEGLVDPEGDLLAGLQLALARCASMIFLCQVQPHASFPHRVIWSRVVAEMRNARLISGRGLRALQVMGRLERSSCEK